MLPAEAGGCSQLSPIYLSKVSPPMCSSIKRAWGKPSFTPASAYNPSTYILLNEWYLIPTTFIHWPTILPSPRPGDRQLASESQDNTHKSLFLTLTALSWAPLSLLNHTSILHSQSVPDLSSTGTQNLRFWMKTSEDPVKVMTLGKSAGRPQESAPLKGSQELLVQTAHFTK